MQMTERSRVYAGVVKSSRATSHSLLPCRIAGDGLLQQFAFFRQREHLAFLPSNNAVSLLVRVVLEPPPTPTRQQS
jgi:hypothetical protein